MVVVKIAPFKPPANAGVDSKTAMTVARATVMALDEQDRTVFLVCFICPLMVEIWMKVTIPFAAVLITTRDTAARSGKGANMVARGLVHRRSRAMLSSITYRVDPLAGIWTLCHMTADLLGWTLGSIRKTQVSAKLGTAPGRTEEGTKLDRP